MAVDKKSDHYTSAQHYKDLDGNMKNFTFVDHDVKSSATLTPPLSDEERNVLKDTVKGEAQRQIEEILALPAVSLLSSGNLFAEDYIERDVEKGTIKWRERMVRDSLTINSDLRYVFHKAVWKNTVKEQHWFDEMSHEDILAGKWKEWI